MRLRRVFFVKISLFFLPILLLAICGTWIAWNLGVSVPLDIIARMQKNNPQIVYDVQFSDYFSFKQISINQRKADILVLGSSRMRSFSQDYFADGAGIFYNGFIPGASMGTAYQLWRRMDTDAYPNLLIIGIDFAKMHPTLYEHGLDSYDVDLAPLVFAYHRTAQFWSSVARGDTSFDLLTNAVQEPLSERIRLGVRAIAFDTGVNADGSRRERFNTGSDFTIPPDHATLERTSSVSQPIMGELETILSDAREHGITVIGIAPPYAPSAYEVAFNGEHPFLQNTAVAVSDLFEKYDAPFLDFSNPASIGIDEHDMSDFWHMNERGSLKMWIATIEDIPQVLNSYVNLDDLYQRLAQLDNTDLVKK